MNAEETARAFVDAVAWGDHHRVWDLLHPEGRQAVLRIAGKRGLDEALAARLRDGTAAAGERDAFLTDLVNGLRADLQSADLDTLRYVGDPAPEPDRVRVLLVAPLPAFPVDRVAELPVGSVELEGAEGAWRVTRLLPRPGPIAR